MLALSPKRAVAKEAASPLLELFLTGGRGGNRTIALFDWRLLPTWRFLAGERCWI